MRSESAAAASGDRWTRPDIARMGELGHAIDLGTTAAGSDQHRDAHIGDFRGRSEMSQLRNFKNENRDQSLA